MDPISTSQAIGAVADEAKGLLNKFLGPGLEEAGEMIADRVRLFRLKQQIKLFRTAEQLLAHEKLEPKAVNLKVLLPLIDAASLEEDEEMSDRWASLLASAANPANSNSLEISFVEILKQLPPLHALIL